LPRPVSVEDLHIKYTHIVPILILARRSQGKHVVL
jgi:hypothetical protein